MSEMNDIVTPSRPDLIRASIRLGVGGMDCGVMPGNDDRMALRDAQKRET